MTSKVFSKTLNSFYEKRETVRKKIPKVIWFDIY